MKNVFNEEKNSAIHYCFHNLYIQAHNYNVCLLGPALSKKSHANYLSGHKGRSYFLTAQHGSTLCMSYSKEKYIAYFYLFSPIEQTFSGPCNYALLTLICTIGVRLRSISLCSLPNYMC